MCAFMKTNGLVTRTLDVMRAAVRIAGRRRLRMSKLLQAETPAFAHGVLHESLGHECLKSSLAFRKPATYADSRHPARTEGL